MEQVVADLPVDQVAMDYRLLAVVGQGPAHRGTAASQLKAPSSPRS